MGDEIKQVVNRAGPAMQAEEGATGAVQIHEPHEAD